MIFQAKIIFNNAFILLYHAEVCLDVFSCMFISVVIWLSFYKQGTKSFARYPIIKNINNIKLFLIIINKTLTLSEFSNTTKQSNY